MKKKYFSNDNLREILAPYLTELGLKMVLESDSWWWGVDSYDKGRLKIFTSIFESEL